MASVVFMRAVNVGGHQTFRPKNVATALADLGAVNVGAAGTFVIRKHIGQAALRAAFLDKLAFAPELMICRARDVIDLARSDPFQGQIDGRLIRGFVSVLQKRPRRLPRLPISQPEGDQWKAKLIAVTGPFALVLSRKLDGPMVYPNALVEKVLEVPATTRHWPTIVAVCDVLQQE